MEEAKQAAVFAMPAKDNYAKAKEDMISGLQRRDLKLATVVNQRLVEELGELMLPTFLLPLDLDEAKAIMRSYPNTKIASCKIQDKEYLKNLVRRIDALVQCELAPNSEKFFVKLSFMSPKDVTIRTTNERTLIHFYQELDVLKKTLSNPHTISFSSAAITRAWLNALYQSIGVRSGHEAVEMLIQSYRIHDELRESLQVDEYYAKSEIIIRPWMKIRPGFEFRVFVSNKKVTGISQYESVYYPEVWSERFVVFPQILDFVMNRVIPRLECRLPSFVVDVIFTVEKRLYVCELNPFASTSSSCLFMWSQDREFLMVGSAKARVVPPPSLKTFRSFQGEKREIRFVEIDPQSDSRIIENIIDDDGHDNCGLVLSEEWTQIISKHWIKKRSYNHTLLIVLSILVVMVSFYVLK